MGETCVKRAWQQRDRIFPLIKSCFAFFSAYSPARPSNQPHTPPAYLKDLSNRMGLAYLFVNTNPHRTKSIQRQHLEHNDL